MRLPYSWPMRWNTRSAPARSTRHATPGYFASNARAIFSETGRSTEVYQASLPSFCAAVTSSGVIAAAGGAAAITRVWAAPRASAADPMSPSRRASCLAGIAFPLRFSRKGELDEAAAEIKPRRRRSEPSNGRLRWPANGDRGSRAIQWRRSLSGADHDDREHGMSSPQPRGRDRTPHPDRDRVQRPRVRGEPAKYSDAAVRA